MSFRGWIWFVLAGLWLWPTVARGQSEEFRETYKRSGELYAQGRYQEALPFAEEALRLGHQEFGPDDPATATLLNNLASLYRGQALYDKAEPLQKQALAIREKSLGSDHRDVALSLSNLAELYGAQGKYAEAERFAQRALGIIETAVGPTLPCTSTRPCGFWPVHVPRELRNRRSFQSGKKSPWRIQRPR